VEAIKKSLPLPERLLEPGNGHGQSLRAPRALGPCGSIGTTARRVMEMRDGDEDFHKTKNDKIMAGKIIFSEF
jgi:hypothetical protein